MNHKFNIRYFVLLAALLLSGNLFAQITRQRMGEESVSGASIFRPYNFDESAESSKPDGAGNYKPFYISHFGRHGSRYSSQQNSWQHTMDCFDAANAEGMLTKEGQSLYSAIKAIYEAHDGMYGELAPLGAIEHRQIATRMYNREKQIFSSKKRNEVRCVSSIYSRCLMSMANFTEELSSLAPQLEISYLAGKRYNDDYINAPIENAFFEDAYKIIDSLKYATLKPQVLMPLYFTDVQRMNDLVTDTYAFEMGLYYFWAISYDMDFLGLDLTPMIPLDELAACSAIDNAIRYAKVAISEEFGKYTRVKGVKMLKDFVAKADDALKQESNVAADLRFAHDSAFLPMCALLGVEGYPVYTIEDAHANWNAADVVPMCSNLQMVFYMGKSDVLVKVLVNEKESHLSGLTPVQGVFYRWDDVRKLIDEL